MLPKDIYIFVHHKVVSDFPFQIMTSTPQIFLISIFTKQTLISPNNTIDTFIVGKDGTLWCGYFGGIFEVRQPFTEHRTINQYLENNRNINFSRTRISSLFIDKFNNLWISTIDRGLYYRSLSSTPFNYLSNSKFQEIGFAKRMKYHLSQHKTTKLYG